MPRYEVEIDGQRYEIEGGDMPPTEADARAAIGEFNAPAETIERPFDSTIQRAEEGIRRRGSAIRNVREQIESPIEFLQQHPIQTALTPVRAAGAVFEAGESIPANIALALQRGDLSTLPEELLEGVTGERPAQFGDVYRAAGVPDPVAAAFGLALMPIPKPTILGKSGTALQKVTRRATQVTGAPTAAAGKTLGAVSKLIPSRIREAPGQLMEAAQQKVQDIVSFPYAKTLEIQQGAINYFRSMNQWYGKQLNKIARNTKGPIPTERVLPILQQRLQQWGLVDQTGAPLQGVHPDFGKAKDAVLKAYEDLRAAPYTTWKRVANHTRAIRQSARASVLSRTQPINQSERLAADVARDMGGLLEFFAPGFKVLNQQYAKRRRFFDDTNTIFKVFKGEYSTGRGEALLSRVPRTRFTNQGTFHLLQEIEKRLKTPIIEPARAYAGFMQAARSFRNIPVLGQVPGIVSGAVRGIAHSLPRSVRELPGQPSDVFPQLGLAGIREATAVQEQEVPVYE